jgi:hypothetical protein
LVIHILFGGLCNRNSSWWHGYFTELIIFLILRLILHLLVYQFLLSFFKHILLVKNCMRKFVFKVFIR